MVVQQFIRGWNYTHVFTSPKIAPSKKFNANILDHLCFVSRFCLLAINKIYLVEEWSKSFRPLYTKIVKLGKRIPPHVPLLRVSAMLRKGMQLCILFKAGFRDNNHLIHLLFLLLGFC